ncbi:hypothetical protein LOC67_11800 [Stieleria sp. JC731]|uniref:galactosyltransferase-related protein n=1 Tax=Pirellulaceae TaxID=2691357 RepID=UPI001E6135D1|nr:galactosyltransferase-related protein [Stieleria sp. JC731]MCC9601231.1 hypothetical protein [Stieleria sp. JC731]
MITFRNQLGCWLHERWKAELVTRAPSLARACGLTWMDLCNRGESLDVLMSNGIRICRWQDSSQLTLARVFPQVAKRLLCHCLKEQPLQLVDSVFLSHTTDPDASILIAIGGDERFPQLETVLRSLAGQCDVSIEVIVCELGQQPTLQHKLPASIRYLHLDTSPHDKFNKSRALNASASIARGRVLFIHDADYLVPCDYVRRTLQQLGDADAIRPCRFLFHASKTMTQNLSSDSIEREQIDIEKIVQNNPTPLAITAKAYERIGGHDEDYFGWGGEDSEFIDRLRTGMVIEGGNQFGIHLWHPPANQKQNGHRNRDLHETKMSIPVEARIASQRQRRFQASARQPTIQANAWATSRRMARLPTSTARH